MASYPNSHEIDAQTEVTGSRYHVYLVIHSYNGGECDLLVKSQLRDRHSVLSRRTGLRSAMAFVGVTYGRGQDQEFRQTNSDYT
jgi:hypothetical protein